MGYPAVDLTTEAARLAELVDEAARSGEVVLTRGGEAVAKIVPLTRCALHVGPGAHAG